LDKVRQTIWIRQIRSGIGCPRKHKVLLRCLGLTRMHKLAERPDTPQIRGMVAKVQHLVEVVKLSDLPMRSLTPAFTLHPPEVVPVEAVTAAGTRTEEKQVSVGGKLTDAPARAAKPSVKPAGKPLKPAKVGRKARAEAAKSKAPEKVVAKKTAATKSKAAKPSKTAKK
jgi:large subunit ribosomal protein L30